MFFCTFSIYDCWWEVRGGHERNTQLPNCDCFLTRRPEVGVFIAAPYIMRKFMTRELRQNVIQLENRAQDELCSIPPPLIGKDVPGGIAPWELRPRADTCLPIPHVMEEEWKNWGKKKKKGKKATWSPLTEKEQEEEREEAKKQIADTLLQMRGGTKTPPQEEEEKKEEEGGGRKSVVPDGETITVTAKSNERRVTRQTSVAAAEQIQKEGDETMEEEETTTENT